MSSETTPPHDDEARERARRGRVTGSLLVLVVVLVFAAGGMLWWLNHGPATPSGDVPLIKADTAPTKTKPEDPGGMPVPNRDKLVYQLMSPNPPPPPKETLEPAPPPLAEAEQKAEAAEAKSADAAEAKTAEAEAPPAPKPAPTTAAGVRELLNLPPPPEAPKRALDRGPDAPAEPVKPVVSAHLEPPPGVREQAPAQPKDTAATAAPADEGKPADEAKPAESTTAKDETAAAPAETKPAAAEKPGAPVELAMKAPEPAKEAPQPAAEAKPAEPPAPEKPAKAAPPAASPAKSTAASAGYRVQIAAFRDEGIVEKEWKRLQRSHADVLGGLSHYVVTIDLGNKGLFHRLQAGPLPDRQTADAACAKLKAEKQDCIVVPPG